MIILAVYRYTTTVYNLKEKTKWPHYTLLLYHDVYDERERLTRLNGRLSRSTSPAICVCVVHYQINEVRCEAWKGCVGFQVFKIMYVKWYPLLYINMHTRDSKNQLVSQFMRNFWMWQKRQIDYYFNKKVLNFFM